MSPLLSSSYIKNNSKTLGIIVDNISAEIIGILKDLILLSAGPTSVTYEIIYPKPLESSIARNAGWRLRNQSTAISSWRASYSVNCLFSSFFSNFSIFYFLSSFSIQNSCPRRFKFSDAFRVLRLDLILFLILVEPAIL